MADAAAEPDPRTVREASAPFDRAGADFVLRTVDGVHFRVFRTILMLGSGYFEGQFSIPQPPAAPDGEEAVDVPEDSETVDTFLRVLYPHTASEVEVPSLSHLRKVLAAGQKYDSPPVVDVMRRALVQPRFLDDDPLRVFAIACCMELEDEAKEAARTAVVKNRLKADVLCAEMDSVSAGQYYRLLQLQARPMLRANVDFTGIGPFCRNPPSPQDPETTIDSVSPPFADADADVILTTRDSFEFRVHRKIIGLASPKMLDMLIRDTTRNAENETATEPPVYTMQESGAVVEPLLRFCYPGKRPSFSDAPNTFLSVLSALKKYGLDDAADEAVHAHWPAFAEKDPFRFFFHAIALRLPEEARTCARLVAESQSSKEIHTLYIPEMESVGSLPYRRLLSYVKGYRSAAVQPFQLLGYRSRPCLNEGCACRARCPTTMSVRAPHPGFEMVFRDIKQRLENRPSGKDFATDLALVGSVVDALRTPKPEVTVLPVVGNFVDRHHWNSSPNLTTSLNGHYVIPPPEFLCAMSGQIEWASSLLQSYADAVERAVSQIELDLTDMIA